MSEMEQLLAMLRGGQSNNLGAGSMQSMGPRPAPQSGYGMPQQPPGFGGGGNQLGGGYSGFGMGRGQANSMPQQSPWSSGPGDQLPQSQLGMQQLGGMNRGGMGLQDPNGGGYQMPQSPNGGAGGGMLQALLGMIGGQSGGMGLQSGGHMYAGGNPNFNESSGYSAAGGRPPPSLTGGYPGPTPQFQPKPFGIPPGMPGGTPGPVRNAGPGVSLARLGMRTAY